MRHPIYEIWRHTYIDVNEERMSEVRKGICKNKKNGEKKRPKFIYYSWILYLKKPNG